MIAGGLGLAGIGTNAYFDNAATTMPHPTMPDYRDIYANPSSLHAAGLNAEQAVTSARGRFGKLIGADGSIIFTSGATESNNLAVFGTLKKNARIITSETEHPSVLEVFKAAEKRPSCTACYIKPDANGRILPDTLAAALTEDTTLVSLSYVNGETGAINDIPALAERVKTYNPKIIFHTDAAQALGKIHISLAGVDLASFSAHKMHGPKGIGALYIKKGVHVSPIIHGGGQQNGLRSGTENVPGILGFVHALGLAYNNMDKNHTYISELKDMVVRSLKKSEGVVNFGLESYSPYILNVSFPGVVGEVLLNALSADGFFVSTGSACHSRRSGASVVSKIAPARAKGSVRISFSVFNTRHECDALIRAIDINVKRLRKVGLN